MTTDKIRENLKAYLCGGAALVLLLAGCLTACGDNTAKESSADVPAGGKTTQVAASTGTPAPGSTHGTSSTTPQTADTGTTGTTQTTSSTVPQAGSDKGDAVAALAAQQKGKTFKWAGAGPDEFDNSGLAYYCYKENGITVPRTTVLMSQEGTEVVKADLQPGDAVFFCNQPGDSLAFVGIYLGDGKFIAAANETKPIQIYNLGDNYWTQRYMTARRYA